MFCTDVGALTASKLVGVNKNTTHRLFGLLRSRIVELAEAESPPFTGSVEVDESCFGLRGIRVLRVEGREEKSRCSPA